MKSISLKRPRFPEAIADLMHSNQFLKTFSVCALMLALLSITSTFVLAFRGPEILTISRQGEVLRLTELPKPEVEIEAAIREYIEKRYQWEPDTVKEQLKKTKAFILPKYESVFDSAISKVIHFSVDRQVSQIIYTNKVNVQVNESRAQVSGHRFTTIQGLSAGAPLNLELTIASGPRTKSNPWGIYVIKEREL